MSVPAKYMLPFYVKMWLTIFDAQVIFGDYRTLHRGTANGSPKMRPLLMHVYGREWWQDAVNYGHNFGGLDRTHGLPSWDADAGAGALFHA